MSEPNLFTYSPPPSVAFEGESYCQDRDHGRLRRQLNLVYQIMSDNGWHTLRELAEAVGCEPQSASARIRDLRKEQYGGHQIERERVEGGLFKYRLVK